MGTRSHRRALACIARTQLLDSVSPLLSGTPTQFLFDGLTQVLWHRHIHGRRRCSRPERRPCTLQPPEELPQLSHAAHLSRGLRSPQWFYIKRDGAAPDPAPTSECPDLARSARSRGESFHREGSCLRHSRSHFFDCRPRTTTYTRPATATATSVQSKICSRSCGSASTSGATPATITATDTRKAKKRLRVSVRN